MTHGSWIGLNTLISNMDHGEYELQNQFYWANNINGYQSFQVSSTAIYLSVNKGKINENTWNNGTNYMIHNSCAEEP